MARPKSGKGSGKGGSRQPAKPAPVSAPGSGARTDGGAGSKRQPIRVPPGQTYGTREAAEASQRAVPLPDTSGPLAGGGGGGAAPGPPGGPVPGGAAAGAFGPTQLPDESPLAGVTGPAAQQEMTADSLLRIMYSIRPSPWIARLLRE